ncbi:MAG: hypothetical protein IJT68_06620 [Lentisphaeria bacterium]|nr:hypothetical protein [Lentisphaeria bacterium]
MSENNTTNNNIPAQPVYIMQQPPQQQNDGGIFDGLGNIALSVLAGLVLGQLGIGFPKLPKL